jgi:(p)ppGpp synthase/HD superfamily hydrolase
MATLERAIEIATEAHRGQLDKAGNEYIGHPLRVMAMGRTTEEKIVGVLHDVVEDSAWTFEQLAAEGFSAEVIEALRCVTKLSETEPYDKFIARIKHNPLAVAVKLNDLTDNMDIRRLPYLSDKDVKRLKKYLKAYKQLTGTPTYSVYACRQEIPNAYDPWSEEDDVVLA